MDSPPVAALTDDMVAEILARLSDPADLVRASAACVPYRRVATDRAFLRRYRTLQAPLLGFLDDNGFYPAAPPHAAAPAARAVSLAADFSFKFLLSSPACGRWVVKDVRGGRVLLNRFPMYLIPRGEEFPAVFMEFAVCDPLHREYVLLPAIPDDLAAAVERPHPLVMQFDRWCEAFLVPCGDDDGEDTSFEVIWMAPCRTKLTAFAFSTATGQWRTVASVSWRDLTPGAGVASRRSLSVIHSRQYAHGCFYWVMDRCDKLLVLDTKRMEFSIADLPPICQRREIAIVEAGEGRVGMFALRDQIADEEASLHYMVRQDGSSPWQVEKIIPLDPGFRHYIRGTTERYFLLLRSPEDFSSSGPHVSSTQGMIDSECLSMDVKTLQLEKVCSLKHHILHAHIYTNFPPSLSSPTVESGYDWSQIRDYSRLNINWSID